MTVAKKSICLNMIVKDESHIILETFTNICKYVDFDYWVISDTGSTDGTQELIKNFFEERKIPGELFEDEWKDFSHNRNKAIEHSVGKSDYIFFFDADDLIHGDFKIPVILDKDYYQAKFGTNFSYNRVIMVSNRELICRYVGVLHEILDVYKPNSTCSTIEGDYFFESRRLGNRSKNTNKYIDDANVLADAFDKETSDLRYRYAYYCAQSFSDSGVRMEEAIKWHKINLDLPSNMEYKYCSCINLGHLYKSLGDSEQSLLYYSKAYDHDNTRIEGITYIMDYYYLKGIHFMVNALWHKFKGYNRFTSDQKIFLDTSRYGSYEWYNIVSGFYVHDIESAYTSCKVSITNNQNHANILQNLNFYREQLKNDEDPILKEYLFNEIKNTRNKSLWEKYQLCIKDYNEEKWQSLNSLFTVSNVTKIKENESSNKILIYTGRMNFNWNDSTLKTEPIGGSEKAVIYLSRNLPKDYDIYIAGDQLEEEFDNIKYVHHSNLQKLIDENSFHTVIVSRYVCFFENFKNVKCYKLIISAHDTTFLHSDRSISADSVLKNYNDYIDHVVCLTKWHESNIIKTHTYLKEKIKLVNNGINIEDFNNGNPCRTSKMANKFMWSSCAGRGLDILLALWNSILDKLPDATLDICSYEDFPKNDDEIKMEQIINNYDSITHHGRLNADELYELMSKSEYWLYTNTFPETSCITAMEMLMSEVICLYYPNAGLNDTIGDYGIKVNQGEEIKELLNLTAGIKTQMKEEGKEYALSCSWKNRAEEWSNVLELNKKKWIFYCSPQFETKMIQQYIDNLNYIYPGYDITLTSNKGLVLHENPSKITFVYEVFDQLILNELPNSQFSFLNTEPLNIPIRLDHTMHILKTFPNFEYYDYSKSNLKILEENEINIQGKIYLPYKCSDDELKKLIHLNKNTKKEFDFGIVKASGGTVTERRLKIVDFLKENNFSINIIDGWSDDRDTELAKCKIILNIHGNPGTTISNIFEHIRCERLLESGFNILSEDSYDVNKPFIEKYPNLQLIIYEDFLSISQIIEYYNNKLGTLTHNNYVLDILQNTHTRINIPNEHINFLEKLSKDFYPENMIVYDIGSSVLHWTQNVRNLWKNSKIYLFDGMTEMKLFYDEYNKQNNTNYDYNVGVLCDEDYKRISFYQNDELSGGNSYYKEIGHPDSHKIFTESNIKHKIGMKLETIVKNKNIPMPDLIKIDVQGAELDILKGSMSIINHAKFLIVELQHTEYNEGAPLCNQTRDFLIENGWQVYAEKFSNNGPDADWCFINTRCNADLFKD
jgi:FkbM family methyltransferase